MDKTDDEYLVDEYLVDEYLVDDLIFEEVVPITNPSSNKPYKDSSEIYEMNKPGVLDRMYTDISNADRYLTRNCPIRSERGPRDGDKYYSRHGQMGTIGIPDPTKFKQRVQLNDDVFMKPDPTRIQHLKHTTHVQTQFDNFGRCDFWKGYTNYISIIK
jgi:hypothetical protein